MIARTAWVAVFSFVYSGFVLGQPTGAPPGGNTGQPGAAVVQPAGKGDAPAYRLIVTELKGKVELAAIDADPKTDLGWTAIKIGDEIKPGTQIRSALRSKAKLILEPANPPSIIMVENGALISLDELFSGADVTGQKAVVTRLGLAYGAIRAGVAEGDVRSDLEIRSPVATLAKRGTWDFRFFAERGTGYFNISLAERGLVQAIQNATGQKINIQPGQFVTQAMARWIETVRFDQHINIQDWYGLKGAELIFNLANQSGLGVLSAAGDQVRLLALSGRQNLEDFGNLLQSQLQQLGEGLNQPQPPPNPFDQFGPRRRPEGDFGIGQGVIPLILDRNNPLVQRGAAAPGRIDVWKSDAIDFVNNQRGHTR